jgi:dimethylaniline monooxygenase (N-oxide forming)
LVEGTFVPLLELNWGKSGSGVPEWETDAGYLNTYYIKTADILPKITFGEITPLRNIEAVNEYTVSTVDDKTIDIDIIIFATGYKGMDCFNFIPNEVKTGKYYDHVFLVEDPSVVKIGFIRPYLTSIPMLIEMQSRYAAKVFAGKVSLPPQQERQIAYEHMKQRQSVEFGYDSDRVSGIVDPYDYMNSIATKIDALPSFVQILAMDPYLWYHMVFHSWSHFVYRLTDVDASKRLLARTEILKLRSNGTSNIISSLLLTILSVITCVIVILVYTMRYVMSNTHSTGGSGGKIASRYKRSSRKNRSRKQRTH